tara:strand:+ start:895 stop:1248 length:354 start_codon:yes stop_codon:yes gene_type:complete
MAIILEPKNNIVSTESHPTYENHTQGGLPLGQLPQGNDEFDAALKKLENTFNVLIDRLNALEGSLKVLQETNKKLESTVALLDPFKQFRENQQSSVATSFKEPLVLTPDMEVKDGHK